MPVIRVGGLNEAMEPTAAVDSVRRGSSLVVRRQNRISVFLEVGMTKKRMLFGLTFVSIFSLGCIVGGTVVLFRSVQPMAEMLAQANLSNTSSEAYVMYRYATYPVAKAALLQYVDQAKGSQTSSRIVGSETATFDVGLTYARLALAAERADHQPDAVTYMNLAKEAFGKQRHPYDETQIRAAVERLDRAWDDSLAGVRKQSR
jgi:hypothetical protein